jgi:hypothetical protein
MTILFPFLQKLPFLLPLTWIIRGIRTVLFRPKNIKQNFKDVSHLTESGVEQMKNL